MMKRIVILTVLLGIILAGSLTLSGLRGRTVKVRTLKVTKPLGFGRNAFKIPNGSTVVHSNGTTEIYDSSGRFWLRVDDRNAGNITTPFGVKKAANVFQVPSGSFVEQTPNGTVVYYRGKVILRVLNST